MLLKKSCAILEEGSITGNIIDEKKLIDNHYYGIASKATILKPAELPVPVDKFESFFGEKWDDVLSAGKVFNAMDACSKLECDDKILEKIWREAETKGKFVKFGGGFYCANVELDGKVILLWYLL